MRFLLVLAFVIPAVLFILAQQKTLELIQPANRLMNPPMVWLQLIPLFNIIWQFFVVSRIAHSIKNEISAWDDDSVFGISSSELANQFGKRPTFGIGIAYCCLFALYFIIAFLRRTEIYMAYLLLIVCLACFICWIIYWIQLARYKRKLANKFL